MILNEINKRPIISFGLGKTDYNILLGETVDVWINTIHPVDMNRISSIGDLEVSRDTTQKLLVNPTETGTFTIQIRMRNLSNTIIKKSNIIILTVT